MTSLKFEEISVATPTAESLEQEYSTLIAQLNEATTAQEIMAVVKPWDEIRRRLETWRSLVHLQFHQDTRNPEYKQARDYADELAPTITNYDVQIKRKLLAAEDRAALEAQLGSQAFALWHAEVTTFDPAIADDLVLEAKLVSQYTELVSSAELEFQGETHNLSSIRKFAEHCNREVRYSAEQAREQWFSKNRAELDRIYHEQVTVRDRIARTLGFTNFIELGYKRMCRVDYNQADVERYRDQVREHVVPFAAQYHQRQASGLGVSELKYWDEALHDPAGNPAPSSDYDTMLLAAREMYDELGGGLGEFFRLMVEADLLDLKIRPGKAGGGFCTAFPTVGLPYVFANFNGSKGDCEVFTHEIGHAFQCYRSRNQPLADYLWPTYESCEIHSMSLEFLTYPFMEKFFGENAERFRQIHLAGALLFLPYGVAVDHFQHLVYAQPEATPDQRHAMWQEMEALYLPWREYGDLDLYAAGTLWQQKQHIYCSPFYYIDYTLAQCCALQFWDLAQRDAPLALSRYVDLCSRGGEAPFQQLVASAGLESPLAADCLSRIVTRARAALAM